MKGGARADLLARLRSGDPQAFEETVRTGDGAGARDQRRRREDAAPPRAPGAPHAARARGGIFAAAPRPVDLRGEERAAS